MRRLALSSSSRDGESLAVRVVEQSFGVQHDLASSTSSLLQDLENKVEFLVEETVPCKKNGSQLKENYRQDRGRCTEDRVDSPFCPFTGKEKNASVNSSCEQVSSTKISRKSLDRTAICLKHNNWLATFFVFHLLVCYIK